jgi:hypothetical protein
METNEKVHICKHCGVSTTEPDAHCYLALEQSSKEWARSQKMPPNIIKTHRYLFLVDDSEIKEGDWHTCTYPQYVLEARLVDPISKFDLCKGCKKIVGHLPINGSPTIKGIDLLPLIHELYYIGLEKGYQAAKNKYHHPIADKLGHVYNILTYDDLSEDEKILAAVEYLRGLI